jgi:hypothetical protein
MYFNDGNSTKLAGPIYTAQQGQTGFIVEDVLDTFNLSHTIVLFYVAQTLMGIYSKDAFTPAAVIPGFSGDIGVGFTASTYTGITFNTLATKASSLLAADGTLKTAANFLATDTSGATTGTISIQNSQPLILGKNSNVTFTVGLASSLFNIKSNQLNQDFEISLLNGTGLLPSLHIDSTNQRVGIYSSTPRTTLDVNGSVIIEGNLTVNGATTTVNSTTVNIEDKFIVLGNVSVPSDILANGGGIQLSGTTTKTFTWNSTYTAWTSSENINLVAGKSYEIGGLPAITPNGLNLQLGSKSPVFVGKLVSVTLLALIKIIVL